MSISIFSHFCVLGERWLIKNQNILYKTCKTSIFIIWMDLDEIVKKQLVFFDQKRVFLIGVNIKPMDSYILHLLYIYSLSLRQMF